MVLHSAPWWSGLALGFIWRCRGSGRGHWAGPMQEAETRRERDPVPRGEVTLTLNSWSVVTGSGMTRGQVNIHFCVKDVAGV